MKINPNYILKTIVDETVIVPTGTAVQYFNGIISTNEVAGFIWQHIEECEKPEDMVDKVLEVFEIDRMTAEKDVIEFLNTLKEVGMIEF